MSDGSRHALLCIALMDGDDATALSIVRGGVDVNGEWDFTHLQMASEYGRVAVVSCLLELGADVEKAALDSWTALGIAAYKGHQEVVELLVEVGNAQLNKQACSGETALHCIACSPVKNCPSIVILLIELCIPHLNQQLNHFLVPIVYSVS